MATDEEVQMMKDTVEANFPGLTDKELDSLLWGATCFPFGSPEQICRQLREHRRTIDDLRANPDFQVRNQDRTDVYLALTIAEAQTTQCMKNEVKTQGL